MLKKFAILLCSFLLTASLCLAQQPLSIQKIKGSIYMVKGGNGANTGFYAGDSEVLVIDAKMTADSEKQVVQEIKAVILKPITRVILTHSDGDHVNGLNGLGTGVKIYAHPQTKKDMEEAAKAPNMEYLNDYLPTDVCSPCTASKESAMNIRIGSETVQLFFFGPAHTSGDMVAYFPAEKIAFIGDLAFTDRDPLIHRAKGGSSSGLLEALKGILSLDADTFISGHSDQLTRKDIQALYDSVSEKRGRIKAMVDEGKSLEEIKKAFGIQEETSKQGGMRFISFVEVVYLELTEKK